MGESAEPVYDWGRLPCPDCGFVQSAEENRKRHDRVESRAETLLTTTLGFFEPAQRLTREDQISLIMASE